jgi:SAM-dependent methyltransferase
MYYFLGLIILIINKLKHLFFGYSKPRPIFKSDIDKNIGYVNEIMERFKNEVASSYGENFSFKDKSVLEIGPGSDLGAGFWFLNQKVKSYVGIDKFNLLVNNEEFYNKLVLNFGNLELSDLAKNINKLLEDKKDIDLSNFKYFNISANELGELNKQFDIIFSHAVLMHINNLDEDFEKMYDSLKKGGIMYHQIDFKTFTNFLRKRDPLNMLRYSKGLYKFIKYNTSPNRLRINDYEEILKRIGFKDIKLIAWNKMSLMEVKKLKKEFTSPFCDYKDEDLQVLTGVVIARK